MKLQFNLRKTTTNERYEVFFKFVSIAATACIIIIALGYAVYFLNK
ncbi:hypothetical protein [Paenibacillus sp. IHBB 10380]|nr:hypothetical protein [Paenibacillus sp. IHBB 10380]